MTIDEIRAARAVLEKSILDKLNGFAATTGVSVTAIEIHSVSVSPLKEDRSRRLISSVEVELAQI